MHAPDSAIIKKPLNARGTPYYELLNQPWTNYGPRAKVGPRSDLVWPASSPGFIYFFFFLKNFFFDDNWFPNSMQVCQKCSISLLNFQNFST